MPDNSRILVMGHVKMDGDSISSAIAMAQYEKFRTGGDFDARVLVPEPLPETLGWMFEETGTKTISVDEAVAWQPLMLVVVDCAPTAARTGFPIEQYMAKHSEVFLRNIDHHVARVGEPEYPFEARMHKLIDPDASSTAEIIITHVMVHPILYVGLVTDTGDFKFSNPNRAMHAALLLNLPESKITEYRDKLDTRLTYEQLQRIMNLAIRHYQDIDMLLVVMHNKDPDVLHTILDLTRRFKYVAIIQSDGYVSLRSRTDLSLVPFVKQCGGGGHAKAAGCMIAPDDAGAFIEAFEKYLRPGRLT